MNKKKVQAYVAQYKHITNAITNFKKTNVTCLFFRYNRKYTIGTTVANSISPLHII